MGSNSSPIPTTVLSATASRTSGRKRKQAHENNTSSASINSKLPNATGKDGTGDGAPTDNGSDRPTKVARPTVDSTTVTAPKEKRLRRFRPQPPKSFHDIYQRATTQRFYVLSRVRHGGRLRSSDSPSSSSGPDGAAAKTEKVAAKDDEDGEVEEEEEEELSETVELTGSTGNIYTVTISRQPTCDCPHAREGHQCKHVVYVLARVLRARFDYVYQLALLRSEVKEILDGAPPPPSSSSSSSSSGDGDGGGAGRGKRKPVEGDCPICFCEMSQGEGAEPVVWCRAACGQNVHKGCFETWAATKRNQASSSSSSNSSGSGGEVTCPYCRSVWEGDEEMLQTIRKDGKRNADGYINVASQLGISTQRDYSMYSRWWSGHPYGYRRRWYY
ncbi:hypothetical protein VTH82DRAFT_2499 [Thermothelomyces myriococcoides]